MKLKPVLVLFFLLMALYFFGIGLLSLYDRMTFLGFWIIGSTHLLVAFGIFLGRRIAVNIGAYVALLDFVFGLLWVIISFEMASVILAILSALALFLLTDEDVRIELAG